MEKQADQLSMMSKVGSLVLGSALPPSRVAARSLSMDPDSYTC